MGLASIRGAFMDYGQLCRLTDDELGALDIAATNIAVAERLPGTESFGFAASLKTVDRWAGLVRQATHSALLHRGSDSENAELTEAQYCILVLVTVLQRNLGVRYNMAFIEGDYDARDARNLFIHGVLHGFGGTCVTLPVLYTAIGRRLGYPLKLVLARDHMFCRWDDPAGERFNIEATAPGFLLRDDVYYREWPFPISDAELPHSGYLISLSPREELAHFVAARGNCLRDNLQIPAALEAFYRAAQLDARHELAHAAMTMMVGVLRQRPELFRLPSGPHIDQLIDQLIDTVLPRYREGEIGRWCAERVKADILRIRRLPDSARKPAGASPIPWNSTIIA